MERCLTVQHCLQAVRLVKWFVFLGLANSGTTRRIKLLRMTRRKGATACKHQEDHAISRSKKLASSAAPGSWLFEMERCLTVQHCLQAVRLVKWFVFLGLANSGTTREINTH
jgi:hypothetical protein